MKARISLAMLLLGLVFTAPIWAKNVDLATIPSRDSVQLNIDAEMARLHDFQTVEFTFDISPHRKFTWHYKYTARQGQNAKQGRIRLK
jgi:hypothetical protein